MPLVPLSSGGGRSAGPSTLTARQRARLMQQIATANLGQPPETGSNESFFGKLTPNIVEDALGQIGSALLNTPGGIYHTGKSGVLDAKDLITEGDLTPERSLGIVKDTGKAIYEDFRHPRENIGYLLMDLFTLASLGAGGATRLSAAGRAAKSARKGFDDPPPLFPDGLPVLPRGPSGGDSFRAAADATRAAQTLSRQSSPGQQLSLTGPAEWQVDRSRVRVPEEVATVHPAQRTIFQDQSAQAPPLLEGAEPVKLGDKVVGDQLVIPGSPPRPAPHARVAEKVEELNAEGDALRAAGRVDEADKVYERSNKLQAKADRMSLREKLKEMGPVERAEKAAPVPVRITRNEDGSLSAEGGLTLRQIEKDTFVMFDGDTPIGPRIKGAKNAVANLRLTAQERKAGEPESILHPESQIDPVAPHAPKEAAADVAEGYDPLAALTAAVDAVPKRPTFRQEGVAPRDMLINPRKLQSAGLTRDQAHELSRRIAPDMRAAYRAAHAAGKDRPSHQKLIAVLTQHLGKDAARELYSRIYKVKGGAPMGVREMIGAVAKALVRGESPGTYTLVGTKDKTIKTTTDRGGGEAPLKGTIEVKGAVGDSAEVLLSRNALVRTGQRIKFGLMQKHPESRLAAFGGRKLNKRVEYENKNIARIVDAATAANLVPSKADVEKAIAKAEKEKRKITIGDVVDTTNQLAQIAVLYLKPAYIPPNLIGQLSLSMADHALNPVSMLQTVRLQRKIFAGENKGTARAKKIKGAMQEGLVTSIAPERGRGASTKVTAAHGAFAKFYNRILDTPFRDHAFITEARRQGFRTAKQIQRLVDDPKMEKKFIEVARRANRNIIDYGRLGPNEKVFLRRLIFFYPWFKGASLYGAHFFAEHPGQALAVSQLGKQADERADEELGPLPSYLEGAFKVGDRNIPGLGKQPKIVNPQAATILGTPAQVINSAKGFVAGGNKEGDAPSEYLTPAASAGIAAITHTDPFTGRSFPSQMGALDIIGQELAQTVALGRYAENMGRAASIERGDREASEFLFPYNEREATGRFVLGVSPYTVNRPEARSRAFAEQRGLESKRQREILRHKDYRDTYQRTARELGVLGKDAKLPSAVEKAFALRGEREANAAALEEKLGRDLRQIDRLQSDLDILVRKKILPEKQARAILSQYANFDDDTIRSFRRKIGDSYFGAEIISYYKKLLNDRGAGITVP